MDIPKYIWLYQRLKEEIEKKEDWEFLGTLKEISKKYKVGRGTTILSLRKLSEEGLIKVIKKKGTFVRKINQNKKEIFVSPEYPPNLHFTFPPNQKYLLFSIEDYLPSHITTWENVIREFKKKYPNIKIKLHTIGPKKQTKEEFLKYITELNPDVFQVLDENYFYLIEKGILLELSSLIKNKLVNLDKFFPFVLQQIKYRNRIFGLPTTLNIPAVFINHELWNKSNLPVPFLEWNWDQYFEYLEKLSESFSEISNGKIIPVSSLIDPIVYFFLVDINLFKKRKLWELRKFLEKIYIINKKGKFFPKPWSDSCWVKEMQLFNKGKILILWDSYIGRLILNKKISYMILPPCDKNGYFPLKMEIVGINQKTSNLGEAVKFISFLSSKEAWKILSKSGFLPPIEGLIVKKGKSPDRIIFKNLTKIYQKVIPYTIQSEIYSPSMQEIIRREFESFLEGVISIDEFLKDITVLEEILIEKENNNKILVR